MGFFVPFFLKKRHHGGVAVICLRVSEVSKRPQVRVFFLKGTVLFFFLPSSRPMEDPAVACGVLATQHVAMRDSRDLWISSRTLAQALKYWQQRVVDAFLKQRK